MDQPIFEENDLDHFKGIDIMRTVRSFDPCLPCGVHMYLGKGKVLKKLHSPTQVANPELADLRPVTGRSMATPQRPPDDRRPDRARLDELRAVADPRVYDRAEELLRLVTELYGAGLARVVERGRARPRRRSSANSSTTSCRQPADRPRAPPRRRHGRGSSARSRACGRSSPSTAATSSCSTSTPTPERCCCNCSAAATGARRRR